MSGPLFNSRDKQYKSKYGAVESGSSVSFRLLLPYTSGAVCYSAHLFIKNDFTGEVTVHDFTGTDRYSDEGRWWELEYEAEEPGLYWYWFEYDGPWARLHIYKGPYSNGYLTDQVSCWQLTVYEKGYRTPERFKGATIYQIFPDRFYASGSQKKNVPRDRILRPWGEDPYWRPDEQGIVRNNDYFGGDLQGIREKLTYIRNLGINVLYLNPIFEAHSNHRYNTADYSKIDPLLGTEEDFVRLCEEAHRLGILVILDGVFSHTGDDSIYFNKEDRYDSLGAYNSQESPYYDWYSFQHWPEEYESWWGFETLPNVNELQQSYVDYITGEDGIIAKWLKLGADGWRLDVADELPDAFIEKIHDRVKATKPEAIVLGEVWEDASNKIAYSCRRKYLLGRELDSIMNYPFANAIIEYLRWGDADRFLEKILTITENYPKEIVDVLMNMLGTHDTARILTRLAGEDCEGQDREWQSSHFLTPEQRNLGMQKERIATALQFTLPGIPSLYYGDEAGMEGYKDPFNRGCFTWDHIQTELSSWYTWLGLLRKTCPVLKEGQFVPISGSQGVIAYARINEEHPDKTAVGDALVIITNANPHPLTYYLPEEFINTVPLLDIEKQGNAVMMPPYSVALLGRGNWI